MTHDPREALQPCPFCGGNNVILSHKWDYGFIRRYPYCNGCGARGPSFSGEEESREWWNTRALTASPGEQEPPPAEGWNTGNLTPEQIYIINDMIHAWIDENRIGEFREAFRDDCKRLLKTAFASSRPDAGGGVREEGECHPVLAHMDEIHDLGFKAGWKAALASNASAEARLRVKTSDGFEVETLGSGRITKIISGPYTDALSAGGDDAKKSEGGLPDWDDFLGIAPNATGDLSSEAFIREQRDSWDDKYSDPSPDTKVVLENARLMDEAGRAALAQSEEKK